VNDTHSIGWIDRVKPWLESLQALTTVVGIIVGGIWTYRVFIVNREGHAHANVAASVSHVALTDKVNLVQVILKVDNTGHELMRLKHATVWLQQVLPVQGCVDQEPCVTDALNAALGQSGRSDDGFPWPIVQQRDAVWTPPRDIEPGESDLSDFEFVVPQSVQVARVYAFIPNEGESRQKTKESGWHVAKLYELRQEKRSTEKP